MSYVSRRGFLQAGLGAATAAAAGAAHGADSAAQSSAKRYQDEASPFPICLNTSSIRKDAEDKDRPLELKVDVAIKCGYDAIEPWIDDIERYDEGGASLEELGAKIKEAGLTIPNVIGLWGCMPATEEEWKASLPDTKKRMERCARLGAEHVAALPLPDREPFDLKYAADRYRDLLKIGKEEYNIIPAFEYVGFFKGVHRYGHAAAVAIDANDRDACLVMDTFHLHVGGSGFNGIRHINGKFIASFHWNDAPAGPKAPHEMRDADRIYPGDGVLPLVQAIKDLHEIGYTGPLSIEMFNRDHWKQDPYVVGKTALEKTLAGVKQAFA